VLLLLLLALVLPLVREAARSGWRVLREAVETSRREAARRELVEGYAGRYGISTELAEAIHGAAEAEGIDPELAFRLVRVESAFRERAVSPVGALGLTQLMPATAADLQPGITREGILERDTNLRLGFRYLRVLLRLYDGDVTEALHAYNRGMGTVGRIRAVGGDPANGYAAHVLGERGASPVRRGPR
jgi:soluble lytic murein transglycosylase-like protein